MRFADPVGVWELTPLLKPVTDEEPYYRTFGGLAGESIDDPLTDFAVEMHRPNAGGSDSIVIFAKPRGAVALPASGVKISKTADFGESN